MKEKRVRRKFTNEEKAAILRRHLVDKIPVSDLCEEHHIQPSLFYLWQRQVMENLGAAFESNGRGERRSGREEALARTVEQLKADLTAREAKLAKKDRVIAELSAEFIEAKKAAGES
jgi:transposase-like protein